MEKQEELFESFLNMVDPCYREAITGWHNELTGYGCKIQIKPSKNGYVVSYLAGKPSKTILNYVFRKKGMLVRLYANGVGGYMAFLDTLPGEMTKAISKASDCKRLLNPEACNPKCSMGYDFLMMGERHQKCRYGAFQFLLTEESLPYIKAFWEHELKAMGVVA